VKVRSRVISAELLKAIKTVKTPNARMRDVKMRGCAM